VEKKVALYGSYVLIPSPPLFTHQYSAVWVDLRDKNDGFADYFENSRIATQVNRQFCLDHRAQYKTYSEHIWGLTACEGPTGYKAYGSAPGEAVHDGTVAPTAAGSSIVFTPELSLQAMKAMYQQYQGKIWGKYGFSDSFNLDADWYAKEVLGIDQGPLLLMIENFRSGFVWRQFMKHPAVIRGMDLIGFQAGTLRFKVPERPVIRIKPIQKKIKVDGNLDEWDLRHPLRIHPAKHLEIGEIKNAADLEGTILLAWSKKYLYVAGRILDDSLVMDRTGEKIWRDDCLELFFDPEENQLQWGSQQDMQPGLSPGEWGNEGRSWAWFQGYEPSERGFVTVKANRKFDGYDIEARISWKFLKLIPHAGLSFGFTPAIHDRDRNGEDGKLAWFLLPDGKSGHFILGKAVLQESGISSP
jgi:hypothetical protein